MLGLFWFWFKNPDVHGNLWAKLALASDCEGEESTGPERQKSAGEAGYS